MHHPRNIAPESTQNQPEL